MDMSDYLPIVGLKLIQLSKGALSMATAFQISELVLYVNNFYTNFQYNADI